MKKIINAPSWRKDVARIPSRSEGPPWRPGLQQHGSGDLRTVGRMVLVDAAARSLGAILQRTSESMTRMITDEMGAAMQAEDPVFYKAFSDAKLAIVTKVRSGLA